MSARLKGELRTQLKRMIFYNVWDYVTLEDGELRIKEGDGRVLEAVESQRTGVKVKFPDRLKAIELLLELMEAEEDKKVEITLE